MQPEEKLQEVIETIPVMAWSAAADGAAEFFNVCARITPGFPRIKCKVGAEQVRRIRMI